MMRIVKTIGGVLLLATAATVSACSSLTAYTWSDEKMTAKTAAILGVSPNDVRLSDMDADLGHTYYKATTRRGKVFKCTVVGLSAPTCKPYDKW